MDHNQPAILRLKSLLVYLDMPRSTLFDLVASGRFPKQIKLTERNTGWLKSEVDGWLSERAAERDAA